MKKNIRCAIIISTIGIFYVFVFFSIFTLSKRYKVNDMEIDKTLKSSQPKIQIVNTETAETMQNKENTVSDAASIEKLINQIKDKTGADAYEN